MHEAAPRQPALAHVLDQVTKLTLLHRCLLAAWCRLSRERMLAARTARDIRVGPGALAGAARWILGAMDAPAFRIDGPDEAAVPLVLDSPHSGRAMPPDFRAARTEAELREFEDCFIDELFGAVTVRGAPLLAANFPRTYLDVNRDAADIDPALLAEPWPDPLRPGSKSTIGKGLIWRTLEGGLPVYERKLSVAEVQQRIARCHAPYHAALKALLDGAHARFGRVLHINCHSMGPTTSVTIEGVAGQPRADFVLGDRDGSTCDPSITEFVRAHLAGLGYDVRVNDPFKGVELVRAYSDPARGRHSLQLEVNKRLYMDCARLERHEGFDTVRARLGTPFDGLVHHCAPATSAASSVPP